MTAERVQTYREITAISAQKQRPVEYILANQALEEVSMQALRGEQPSERVMWGVRSRLRNAAEANADAQPFVHYRARLLAAYVLPIVYSGVINVSLTSGQAKRVAQQIDIAGSYSEGLDVAQEALEQFDAVNDIQLTNTSMQLRGTATQLSGFLHEATAISLVDRPKSAKIFAVPTMAYDDEYEERRELKSDGIVFDQRPKNVLRRRNPFQVKATHADDYSIPVITGNDMANQTKASAWPHHDEKFTTLRMLIAENNGNTLDSRSLSTLDRLSGFVVQKVLS
ncbi:MAG: hypothetical protein WBK76_05580 [Candidatus Saccharimonadales bacterium]